jgi:hypothetical protein
VKDVVTTGERSGKIFQVANIQKMILGQHHVNMMMNVRVV